MMHFWPPITIASDTLTQLVDEFDRITPETRGHAGAVLEQLAVDYDEDSKDAVHLACVIVAMAAKLAEMRRKMADATDVPAVTLAEAVDENDEDDIRADAKEELYSLGNPFPRDWQVDDMAAAMRERRLRVVMARHMGVIA
jgi:hypothetical protein